jgi:mannose-6-phosphate isomerase-like protein (cupin superfamily)
VTAADAVVVLGPGQAKEILDVFGGLIAIQADGADTRNAYALLQMSAPGDSPPREAFPPQHIHHQEEEAWFILEGTFEFQVGGRSFEVGAGSFVLAPRGTAHTFRATGPQPPPLAHDLFAIGHGGLLSRVRPQRSPVSERLDGARPGSGQQVRF